MGLDTFRFSDNDVYTKEGNPPFTLTIPEAFREASGMYHEMDGEIGAFFDSMTEAGALDVESRHNKAGGGYCTFIGDYHQPFIFANFNGTTADADVLTHEFGHAYASHCIDVGGVDYDIDVGGMETAECHSMSMEFLCWPYMRRFFGERERGYRYKHLADALSFIPYGCIVDEFQASRLRTSRLDARGGATRRILELEKAYRPYLTYEGIPYLEEGTRWQYQAHIFESPFYYIDYCLAQTVGLRVPRALAERPRRSAPPLQTVRLGGRHDCLPQPCKTGRGLPIPSAKVPFKTLPRKFRASCKPSSRNNPTENAVLWRAATKQFSETGMRNSCLFLYAEIRF